MGKMRGTRSMGHGPSKTSMRTRGRSMGLKGTYGTRSINLGRSISDTAGSARRGIARSGNTVGRQVPVKVSNVQLGNS